MGRRAENEATMTTDAQDDFLIVFALTELARNHTETPEERRAIELADRIATRHDLTPREAIEKIDPSSWDG